ncbi:uncharacterized protein LAJ45_05606 [Morchella importuna]|nr:uncharacterized protein H6S33_001556 [Morchella sextelata]XP_045971699.1 uncharacterized protein LAJ45_05606 [Morchella importuna]KAH0608422.1 hypothetical protein H6S33_001556 [Morchella sextelata]KAH8150395.1 hypothetical protein LAJ45_05606 [Morchella importuna]
MVVKLRLARFGVRHAPVYNIVVAHARTARDSRPLEVIGTYDPIPKPPADGIGRPVKDIQLDTARAKYWIGVGAQPTDTVWRLLAMFGLLEPKWPVARIQQMNPEAGPKVPKSLKQAKAGATQA